MADYYAGMVVCALSLVWLAVHYLREWNDRLEARRAHEDAEAFHAQQAAMTDDEIARMREWQDVVAATDGTDSPLYGATAAYILRHQLEDPAAVDRFLGRDAG